MTCCTEAPRFDPRQHIQLKALKPWRITTTLRKQALTKKDQLFGSARGCFGCSIATKVNCTGPVMVHPLVTMGSLSMYSIHSAFPTFFRWSFCFSLKSSIFLASSRSVWANWMWPCPTLSTSENKKGHSLSLWEGEEKQHAFVFVNSNNWPMEAKATSALLV